MSDGASLTVLVTGATGFIGRRLVPELVERGLTVRAMTRRPEAYDGPGEAVGADVHRPETLGPALAGADVAVYLVHSLDDPDFERKDADAARAFGRAAADAGVRQVVERLKPLSVASLVAAYESAMDDAKREGIARRSS